MITTLTGSNSFLLNAELRKLKDEFVNEFGDIGYEILDGEEAEIQRLTEAMQSLPFLAPKKLVVLKNPSAQKQFMEQIEQLIKNVPESSDVVIIETKLDKRSVYFKVLKAKTEYKEFVELDAYNLNNWIVQYVKNQEGSITTKDAQYLLERIGPNQRLLATEIDKLLTYNSHVDRSNIDLLTEPTPRGTIFELLDAAFAGKAKRVSELYSEQRALKVEPQQIIALLAWQLHALAIVKAAGEQGADKIAKETRLNPFVVRKTQQLAKQLTLGEVKALVSRALQLDVRLKSESIDADEALQHFLLTII